MIPVQLQERYDAAVEQIGAMTARLDLLERHILSLTDRLNALRPPSPFDFERLKRAIPPTILCELGLVMWSPPTKQRAPGGGAAGRSRD